MFPIVSFYQIIIIIIIIYNYQLKIFLKTISIYFFLFFQPPILPRVSSECDSSNFDEYPETDWRAARTMDKIEMKLFEGF